MKRNKISQAVGNLNEKYITEAANYKVATKHTFIKFVAVAACFLLVVGLFGIYNFNSINTVASTISLDVNPAIEIDINKNEKVLSVEAKNEDAKKVIGNMNLEKTDLETTLNALVGSLLRNGYITAESNSVLVSVENEDELKGAKLKEKIASEINALLQTKEFKGAVLSQTVNPTSELKETAEKYGITLGKVKLIKSLTEKNKQYTFEELVPLTVNELNLLANSKTNEIKTVKTEGEASKTAYIGESKAYKIALNHAGVSSKNVISKEIDIDFDEKVIVYDVDFETKNAEYEYEINAKNGKIVKFEKDVEERLQTTKPTTSSKPSTSSSKSSSGKYIGKQAAKNIALKNAGLKESGIYAYSNEFDYDDGVAVYEIEFKQEGTGNEYDYKINAKTGKIIESEKDIKKTSASTKPKAYISKAKAKSVALNRAGVSSSQIRGYEISFDKDDGLAVYEIEFRVNSTEYSIEVNAKTGKIVSYEADRDD